MPSASYELVIRGGTCFDGLGSRPFTADVAVRNGTIVDIGTVTGAAEHTIDADGCFVAPGFVDGHTHLDAQIFWDPHGAGLTGQGVTSAVMGNCGFTLAPGSAAQADLVVRAIERAEEMSREAIGRGVPWTWTTFAGYLGALEVTPKALNVATQVGHSAVRVAVMGERAFSDEATDDDIRCMEAAVREAMEAGSLGFTTSRSWTHVVAAGTPVPSRFASWEEVRRLVHAMAASGTGMFQFAPERPRNDAELADFRRRVGTLAVEAGRPVTFLVGGQDEQLDTLDAVRAIGGRAIGQVHVRGYQAMIGFETKLPFDRLPTWSQVRAASLDEQRERLRDAGLRRRLVEEAEGAGVVDGVGGEVSRPRFDEITVVDGSDDEPSVASVAQVRRTTPVGAIIDLAVESDLAQLFRQPLLSVTDDDVLASFRHAGTVIAASDAGAHVSRSVDVDIPTYLLAHWVRTRGELSWEQAICMLTSVPAEVWGFDGRGVLREGAHADVVVFDPETVGGGIPRVVHDLPDGGPRVVPGARGIHATVVAGRVVHRDGEPTDERPGRVLRGSAAHGTRGGRNG